MLLSIVIPCYNESGNVAELYRQLQAVAERVDGEVEFVFVDDGSRDDTLEQLRELTRRDPRVRVLSLSRNFGHQAALTAGIEYAAGDAVAVMDADLQHPPELILDFLRKWREGYDLVYGYRQAVKPRLGYRLINALMKINIPAESADFRLMDRKLVDALCRMPERARFIRGMIAWLGFRQTGIGYSDRRRFAGSRSYSLRQTARMALYAVLAFSSIPLRIAAALGLVTLMLGLLYAVYILYAWLAGRTLEGWTGQTMTILILGGVQLLCLGIIAEYIGRIFEEVKHRPLYVVRECIGPDRDPASVSRAETGGRASRPSSTGSPHRPDQHTIRTG